MPADVSARKTISTPLGDGTLNARDFNAASAYGPPIRVLPDVHVLKIGGQSVFDRGKAAVWPLVEEIAACAKQHQLIVGMGGGTRSRHAYSIGLELGLSASIMVSATLCFSRWAQRRGRHFHRFQYRGKHRARFLTEKALRCRRPVRPSQKKVVHGGEARTLSRQVESSPLMAASGQGAIAPCHMGTRAREHGRQPFGLVMEVVLRLRTQRVQDAARCKQGGAQSPGEFAKGFAIIDAASPGHAIEIVRRDALGVHGQGDRWLHSKRSDLLSAIMRDELDGALHCRHHPLSLGDALQAALTESFVLGHGAHRINVLLHIRGKEVAMAASPALEIDKGVVVAHALDTCLDLCTLLTETRGLTTGRCESLLGLFQAYRCLWRAPRSALCGFGPRAWRVAL